MKSASQHCHEDRMAYRSHSAYPLSSVSLSSVSFSLSPRPGLSLSLTTSTFKEDEYTHTHTHTHLDFRNYFTRNEVLLFIPIIHTKLKLLQSALLVLDYKQHKTALPCVLRNIPLSVLLCPPPTNLVTYTLLSSNPIMP